MADDQGSHEQSLKEFYLYSYGSLIWKPPPHFDKRLEGFVRGWVRRFTQSSEDHRGTPEAPGRVVTLVERSAWESLAPNVHHDGQTDVVWGVAYRFLSEKLEEVKDYLDIREINGYSLEDVDFYPRDGSPRMIKCKVYIGLPHNPQFVGPEDPESLAKHILRSKGPSGSNVEYLLKLDEAIEAMGSECRDEHVHDLARRVRKLQARDERSDSDPSCQ